jgi:chromosomal replication initiation ATPase DnaA
MTSTLAQLEAEKRAIQQRIEQRKAHALRTRQLQWEILALITAEIFDAEIDAILKGRQKMRGIADARQVAMALTHRLYPDAALTTIAKFYDRDHATVIQACRAVEAKCSDPKFKEKVERVNTILLSRFAQRQGRVARRQSTCQ